MTFVTARKIFTIVLFMLPPLPPVSFAGSSLQSTRHFEGTRYLVLSEAKVFAKPSADSRIVSDIRRWTMVYAVRTSDPRWLSMRGSGARPFPDSYQRANGDTTVSASGGRFVLSEERLDRDDYRPVIGYIEAARLGDLDTPPPLPIGSSALRKVESTWADTGIEERRFVPVDSSTAPFSSVVTLVSKNEYGYFGFCTGFFLESTSLIASAGHCFSNERKAQELLVGIPKGSGFEFIPFTLLEAHHSDKVVDWALLRLEHPPSAAVQPLYLPTRDNWQKSGKIAALGLGFGGDLNDVKVKQFGRNPAHGDVCEMPTSALGLKLGEAGDSALKVNALGVDCVITRGDSGGPLIVWNPSHLHYEVIGITSWGDGTWVERWKLDDDARALYDDTVARLHARYGPDYAKGSEHGPRFWRSGWWRLPESTTNKMRGS